jgi:hypothetical protein
MLLEDKVAIFGLSPYTTDNNPMRKSNISRRNFLRIVSGAFTGSLVSAACGKLDNPTITPSKSSIPGFPTETETTIPRSTTTSSPTPRATNTPAPNCDDMKLYQRPINLTGEKYEIQVPDTFDFQEHAELAINALTRCVAPDSNYAVYMFGSFDRNPPVMYELEPNYGKFAEALAMMRIISGSQLNEEVDKAWGENFYRLLWWTRFQLIGICAGRYFAWFSLLCSIEQEPCFFNFGDQVVIQLTEAAIWRDNYCFFPEAKKMPTGWQATYQGWTLQGITHYYRSTGSISAGNLAKGLAYYLKEQSQIFNAEGHFQAYMNGKFLQFHHNANTLVSIVEYAALAGDTNLAAFAKSGYEWARAKGSPLVGYFSENLDRTYPQPRNYDDCETCCVADMILLALNLTLAGQGDYWDDVDRYVRNQLSENQLKTGKWIDQNAARMPRKLVAIDEDADHVSTRAVGSFTGWATANDYVPWVGEPFMSSCCTGNGSRALYYVWKEMIKEDHGKLWINLLLNRASPWVDINSYLPYEGRVDVLVKRSCDLEIRLPEWVQPAEASCQVNGLDRQVTFQSRYAQIGHVEEKDLVSFVFPISERVVQATIGYKNYTLTIKGNDVVDIRPRGHFSPYYQRARFRENKVQWVKRQRFVADRWG